MLPVEGLLAHHLQPLPHRVIPTRQKVDTRWNRRTAGGLRPYLPYSVCQRQGGLVSLVAEPTASFTAPFALLAAPEMRSLSMVAFLRFQLFKVERDAGQHVGPACSGTLAGYRPVGVPPPGSTARLDMTARRPGRTSLRARLRRKTLPRVPRGGSVAPRGSRLRL